jgi:hypothetical protein
MPIIRSLEEADRPEDVDISVEIWFPHRATDIHLGGLVTENLWAAPLENLFAAGADVLLEEMGTFGYVLALATREVIHDGNLVAAGEEMLGHVRANETGTARQQYTHLKKPRASAHSVRRTS